MKQPHNERRIQEHTGKIMMPKTDEKGRIYREVRCPNCRSFICDEYIRLGRIRFKCFTCGRIIIMEFKPYRSKRGTAPVNSKVNEEQQE